MRLQYPLKGIGTTPGIYLTQKFGENPQMYAPYKGHQGIDWGCPTGTEVYAAHDGTITFNENPGGYGHFIYNESPDHTYRTIYGHLNDFVGQPREVKAGELIAHSNNTGDSTGPHLHFGLQLLPLNFYNGYAGCTDPQPYLTGEHMNETKVVLSKDGQTIYLATPIAMDYANFLKQASVEGITVPEPVPPASSL